jgi:hypothetical protein
LDRETRTPAENAIVGPIIRAIAVLCAATVMLLMLVAVRLEPNPAGLGTHQQLGLPPCTMRVFFELRCPACGMTTAWAHFVRGDWLNSARANLGGFLLALYCLWAGYVCARVGLGGVLPADATQKTASFALLGIAMITMLEWAGRVVVERWL